MAQTCVIKRGGLYKLRCRLWVCHSSSYQPLQCIFHTAQSSLDVSLIFSFPRWKSVSFKQKRLLDSVSEIPIAPVQACLRKYKKHRLKELLSNVSFLPPSCLSSWEDTEHCHGTHSRSPFSRWSFCLSLSVFSNCPLPHSWFPFLSGFRRLVALWGVHI